MSTTALRAKPNPRRFIRRGGGSAMLILNDSNRVFSWPTWRYPALAPAMYARRWRPPTLTNGRMPWEMENLKSHHVYELVPRTNGMYTLELGWVLRRKFKIGLFERNKGKLVARGNHQCPGIGYGESVRPSCVSNPSASILALAAIRDPDVIQFDITSAYLHGTLMEEVYIEQPAGCVAPGKEDCVWRLEKGLYGLVQAGRT